MAATGALVRRRRNKIRTEFTRLLEWPASGRQVARENLQLRIGTNPGARSVRSRLQAQEIRDRSYIAMEATKLMWVGRRALTHRVLAIEGLMLRR